MLFKHERHIPSPRLFLNAIRSQSLLKWNAINGQDYVLRAIQEDDRMLMSTWGAVCQAVTQALERRITSEDDMLGAGTVTVRTGAESISAELRQDTWKVMYTANGKQHTETADIVVKADRSHSIIRDPMSSSYPAWRGRIPETVDLPSELNGIWEGKLIWIDMHKHYISMWVEIHSCSYRRRPLTAVRYAVPSNDESNDSKHVEFYWYFEDSPELSSIVADFESIDRSGNDTLELRTEVWKNYLDTTRQDVPPMIRSLLSQCETPLAAKVMSVINESAIFHNGLFFLGEAFAQLSPQLGANLEMAAMQAITLKDLFDNEHMTPQDWNEWVVDFAQKMRPGADTVMTEYGKMEFSAM